MVKFSKELEAQLIPEWKDAFVNYWILKKHVKNVKLSRKSHLVQDKTCGIGRSIFNPIRIFANKISQTVHNARGDPDLFQVRMTMI